MFTDSVNVYSCSVSSEICCDNYFRAKKMKVLKSTNFLVQRCNFICCNSTGLFKTTLFLFDSTE
jgi:hypothetical protein